MSGPRDYRICMTNFKPAFCPGCGHKLPPMTTGSYELGHPVQCKTAGCLALLGRAQVKVLGDTGSNSVWLDMKRLFGLRLDAGTVVKGGGPGGLIH